ARVAGRMLAGVVRPVALIRAARVPVVGTRGARRLLRVGRAGRTRPGAILRRVALAARRPAGGRRRLESVVRARAARSGAELVEVAIARRGAADRPGVTRRVLAGIARAVTGVGGADVAVIRAEGAPRLLGVGRARLARQPAAGLGDVALPGRGPAGEHVRQHDVRRAGAAHAGAHLVRIARIARARPADGAGVARRVLAGVVRAVAEVGRADVPVVGARRARRRLGIRRAARPGPGAHLRRVALARRGAADDEARLEHVVGTRAARPRAGLVDVAGPRRGAADRARVARRVLAGVARLGGADVAGVGAGRAARLLRIGRTVRAVAGTGLGEVAFARRRTAGEGRRLEAVRRAGAAAARAGLRDVASTRRRRPADGAPVPGVVDAERATDRAIALVRRAHVAIVRAGGARRRHGVVRTGRAR